MTLEEKILKILLDNTDTEGRYVGGGYEPKIIVFNNSEDCDKDIFLSQIRDEIISELKPVMGGRGEVEEKIKEASDKWQSRYYESNYTLDDNAKFAAGAKWMLSELKPAMEELQATLKNIEPFCDERLKITTQSNASSIVFQFNKEVITVSHLKQIKQALSKYNELFKK